MRILSPIPRDTLHSAVQVLEEYKELWVANQDFETALEAHNAAVAIRKVMERCGLREREPKYRAYTPSEAAAHLGRKFYDAEYPNPECRIRCLNSVGVDYIHDGRCISLLEFAKRTWADTGEPCGVKEDEP